MLRTAVLLAGLGAALLYAAWQAASGDELLVSGTHCEEGPVPWNMQCVSNGIVPGQTYRLDGCLTITAPGVEYVALRVVWYEQLGGFGPLLDQQDERGNPSMLGEEQCLALTDAEAPCAARSARYGVVAKGSTDAVEASSLEFAPQPEATPVPCPTPTPTPKPAATPTPTSTPLPEPTLSAPTGTPLPEPTPTPQATEPNAFASLVNGGFEEVREDGTPYGWHKIGGEMSASRTFRAEGARSAALASHTAATKWIYETVRVQEGTYYRLEALALKNDPGVREVMLRIAWYETADGSGSQIGTADSQPLADDSPGFAALDTGPVQAPPQARSAKVRLLLRPASRAPAVAYFDAVRFGETDAPIATAADKEGQTVPGEGWDNTTGDPARDAPDGAEAAVLSAWAGPTSLANVRQEAQPRANPTASGGRPLWPLLLAFGMPAAALVTTAGHAWWRSRLAARNGGHL